MWKRANSTARLEIPQLADNCGPYLYVIFQLKRSEVGVVYKGRAKSFEPRYIGPKLLLLFIH